MDSISSLYISGGKFHQCIGIWGLAQKRRFVIDRVTLSKYQNADQVCRGSKEKVQPCEDGASYWALLYLPMYNYTNSHQILEVLRVDGMLAIQKQRLPEVHQSEKKEQIRSNFIHIVAEDIVGYHGPPSQYPQCFDNLCLEKYQLHHNSKIFWWVAWNPPNQTKLVQAIFFLWDDLSWSRQICHKLVG